jgi:hypothetical protein
MWGRWSAALLGIPLLFGAVWARVAITDELREHDRLVEKRKTVDRSVQELTGTRQRLRTWKHLASRARSLGLRAPEPQEVVWIALEGSGENN